MLKGQFDMGQVPLGYARWHGFPQSYMNPSARAWLDLEFFYIVRACVRCPLPPADCSGCTRVNYSCT